ncbi:MAG: hypothetical protein Q9P14_11630 [candidate division KSB1 bacterium]|nr:hypothetical protein [candidate division KSB1 bacterium]
MATKYILTDYVCAAMSKDTYEKIEDGTYAGKISAYKAVVGFGKHLEECRAELQFT